jgi:hypothetical protein
MGEAMIAGLLKQQTVDVPLIRDHRRRSVGWKRGQELQKQYGVPHQ